MVWMSDPCLRDKALFRYHDLRQGVFMNCNDPRTWSAPSLLYAVDVRHDALNLLRPRQTCAREAPHFDAETLHRLQL